MPAMGSGHPVAPSSRASRPQASLINIRARHSVQCANAVTISAVGTLLSDLNSLWEIDHRSGTQQSREDRIDSFRQDWLMGMLARVPPLELLGDGEEEVHSDGRGSRRSTSAASTVPSVLASSSGNDPVTWPAEARQHFLPPDSISRGVLAELTIKRALDRKCQLLPHKDYASLAAVARKAVRQTLASGKPVFVAPGLVDSVDWTQEYRERGWAAPGVRFGVFKPDLIRFEELKRRGGGDMERVVTWEVVEVKWMGKATDCIYTNWKVQAVFYHLSLVRIFSPISSLVPSHKLSFFISRDAISPTYEERSLALRTVQAYVEHHLFVLLPQWLQAVREEEWQRLQELLKADVRPETPVKGASQSFLEKLQASVKATPPTPGRARRHPPSPSKAAVPGGVSATSAPLPSCATPSPPLPACKLPFPVARPTDLLTPVDLPPLPPQDAGEERDLLGLTGLLDGLALA